MTLEELEKGTIISNQINYYLEDIRNIKESIRCVDYENKSFIIDESKSQLRVNNEKICEVDKDRLTLFLEKEKELKEKELKALELSFKKL